MYTHVQPSCVWQVPRTDDDAKALELDAENPKSPREERPKKFGGVVRAVAATALYCLAGPCLMSLMPHRSKASGGPGRRKQQ